MRRTGVNGDADARTPLIGGRAGSGGNNYSWDENEPAWKRYPKHLYHLTKKTLMSNYVNVLLVFVPLGIIAGLAQWDPVTVFVLNFFAIVPLAALLSFATEQLALKVGQTLGGLLNATFGNAVELIVRAPRCDDMRPSNMLTFYALPD
jgi:Ca2+:H+ antiporter